LLQYKPINVSKIGRFVIQKLQNRKIWNVFLCLYPVSLRKCQLLLKNQLEESLAPRVRCVRWYTSICPPCPCV